MKATIARRTKAQPPADELPPPACLAPDEATTWREVVAHLRATDDLLAVDAGTIETYCLAVARQRRISAELRTGPLVDADGRLHPLLRVLEATAATVKNLGHVLKLNPTARKGATKPPARARGVWAGILE